MLDWTAFSWIFFKRIFETFLEGFVDHIIYGDYIANRRSSIYCSLAGMIPYRRCGSPAMD